MSQIKVELQEWMGSDAAIGNAAWTSTYDKTRREDKYDDADKVSAFVKRLAGEGHSVPFESVIFRFWIRHPIFVDRQHMTHRVASHNGLSGRYRTMPSEYFKLPPDVRGILQHIDMNIISEYNELLEGQHEAYSRWLISLRQAEKDGTMTNGQYKRARELLRGVLGTSFMVERTSILNLRSFANYQRLRNSDHAQAEIRGVAQMMLEQVEAANICPIAIAALKENGWRV